ncbi:putative Cysteine/Histidine-rich C1 domain family protein [Hibiscus syriacus]|uniref:Cysteine/Histidine-rich C1 domain family protein n=1 Tax=Hibiscus syriacus TaxID=106335 RepID=A0A6A3BRE3_HIBSY|nr:uncharacterized protein LOC120213426 [Hibiscus syriacus]KAE8717998.1 putative Cysteine/Histidine-rich C1 domain family protein [Hibiscus syriacus]
MVEEGAMDPSFSVIKMIKVGEKVINTEINHFSHQHNLVLSDQVTDQRYCDGCTGLTTTSSYGFDCDFFLHESCAKLPRKMKVLGILHQDPVDLIPNCLFICNICHFKCSGFAYKCMVHLCNDYTRVRCAEFHKHPLLFYYKYDHMDQYCNACGENNGEFNVYRCKACNFNVHFSCHGLPQTAWYKFDRHRLVLTYHEDNGYSEYLYCDICEEERSTNTWFYYCEICDNSAHHQCILPDYWFIKRGITFREIDHPPSLEFVQKVYDYPESCICGKHCLGLAVECSDVACKYIINWECNLPFMSLPDGKVYNYGSQPSNKEIVAHGDQS